MRLKRPGHRCIKYKLYDPLRGKFDNSCTFLLSDLRLPPLTMRGAQPKPGELFNFPNCVNLPMKTCYMNPFPSPYDALEMLSQQPVLLTLKSSQKYFVPSRSYIQPEFSWNWEIIMSTWDDIYVLRNYVGGNLYDWNIYYFKLTMWEPKLPIFPSSDTTSIKLTQPCIFHILPESQNKGRIWDTCISICIKVCDILDTCLFKVYLYSYI